MSSSPDEQVENGQEDGPQNGVVKPVPRCELKITLKKPQKKVYTRRQINTNGIRLDKLSFGTLRRYQYFFGLEKKKD